MSYCWCLCAYCLSLDSVQDGGTALHKASEKGYCEIVKMLVEAKADVNLKTNVSESCSSEGSCLARLSQITERSYSVTHSLSEWSFEGSRDLDHSPCQCQCTVQGQCPL